MWLQNKHLVTYKFIFTWFQFQGSELNATHIVIQNGNKVLEDPGEQTIEKIHYSYQEAASLPILHVRCKVIIEFEKLVMKFPFSMLDKM